MDSAVYDRIGELPTIIVLTFVLACFSQISQNNICPGYRSFVSIYCEVGHWAMKRVLFTQLFLDLGRVLCIVNPFQGIILHLTHIHYCSLSYQCGCSVDYHGRNVGQWSFRDESCS